MHFMADLLIMLIILKSGKKKAYAFIQAYALCFMRL